MEQLLLFPEAKPELDEFYVFMLDYLNHNRKCPRCGERMWVSYADGHVADECLKCYVNKWSLDLAGYIGNWAKTIPKGTMPRSIDFIQLEPAEWRSPHEGHYRMKRTPTNPSAMRVGIG